MEWNVYRYDFNRKEIVIFNIFNHREFKARTESYLKKYDNKEEFADKLKTELMSHFWARYEYEILISRLNKSENDDSVKVDIYSQVKLNWDRFVDYCWSFKK